MNRGGLETPMGLIRCALEMNGREFSDPAMRVKEEIHKVLTAAPLTLGDRVDNRVVKRVDTVLGITLAEIQ
jgi:hypothetical protein